MAGKTQEFNGQDAGISHVTNKHLKTVVQRELYKNIKPWTPRKSRWQRTREAVWFQAGVSIVFSLVVVLLIAALFSGCGPSPGRSALLSERVARGDIQRYDIGEYYPVIEFHLSDGTRCVALNDSALACEWKQ